MRINRSLTAAAVAMMVAFAVHSWMSTPAAVSVEVEGTAFLQIRMEPAASADLSGEEVVRTYTGPDRVRGETTRAAMSFSPTTSM